MARRRARFGRLPKVAPSLTQTIISAANEMENRRAQNLMDAWSKGGTFEGQPATDESVLAFWKDRLVGIDKTDPLYDTYHNLVQQYDYTIHKSKEETLYAQGKISEQTLGRFYLNWAKKVPKNSEFYRELQRDGARFLQAAAARGRSGRAAAKNSAYVNAQNNLAKGTAASGLLDWALTGIANVNGLLGANDTKGLSNLSDPAKLASLIQGISDDPSKPLFQVGDQIWTGATLEAALKKADPNFQLSVRGAPNPSASGSSLGHVAGGISLEYIRQAMAQGHAAHLQMAATASANGHKQDFNDAMKLANGTQETIREIAIWGAAPAYDAIIAQRDMVLNDPAMSGEEKSAALQNAAKSLEWLAGGASLDLRTSTTLLNEAAAHRGDTTQAQVSSFGEDYLGLVTQAPGKEDTATKSTSVNERISSLSAQLQIEHDNVAQFPDQFTYVYGKRDAKTGVFTFDPNGKELGVATQEEVGRSGFPLATMAVTQVTGKPLLITVLGHPVKTIAYSTTDENDPNRRVLSAATVADGVADPLSSPTVATVYTTYGHDGTTRGYQISDGHGGQVFTTVPPWAANARETDDGHGGVVVDMTDIVLAGRTFDAPTTPTGETVHTFYNNADVLSSIRDLAGPNSDTDFSTPLMMSLNASPDARQEARALVNDPTFMAALNYQETVASGGDATRLADIQALNSNRLAGAMSGGYKPNFDRNRFDPAFSAGEVVGHPDQLTPENPFYNLQAIDPATGKARYSIDNIYQSPQINQPHPFRGGNQLTVTTQGELKVPAMPVMPPPAPFNTGLPPAPAVAPSVTPTVTPAITPLPPGVAGVAGKIEAPPLPRATPSAPGAGRRPVPI